MSDNDSGTALKTITVIAGALVVAGGTLATVQHVLSELDDLEDDVDVLERDAVRRTEDRMGRVVEYERRISRLEALGGITATIQPDDAVELVLDTQEPTHDDHRP